MSSDLAASPILSILLVSYNSRPYLEGCLRNIVDRVSVSNEIILIDNASQDDSVDFVRENYPQVQIRQARENLGFSKANNLAAKEARGQFLLLLNCDTLLLSDPKLAIELLVRESSIGIVGARMLGGDGKVRPSTGHFPTPWRLWKIGWLWSDPKERPFRPNDASVFTVDWVEGSFLLTARETWDTIGGLNETGFMYVEDVEFCAEVSRHGLLTVQDQRLSYIHFGGFNGARTPLLYAGYRRYHAKLSGRLTRLHASAVMLIGLTLKTMVFALSGAATRRQHHRNKAAWHWNTLRDWRKLAPKVHS